MQRSAFVKTSYQQSSISEQLGFNTSWEQRVGQLWDTFFYASFIATHKIVKSILVRLVIAPSMTNQEKQMFLKTSEG